MEEKHDVDFIINTIIGILKHQEKGKLEFGESSFHDIFDKNQDILKTEEYARELNGKRIIDFWLYADDGFEAEWTIEILNMKELVTCLDEAISKKNSEIKDRDEKIQSLINEKNEILSYDPEAVKESISNAQKNINTIKSTIAETDLLSSLMPTIEQTEKYISSVSEVNNDYVNVYKNIILPLKKESESGVNATVKWAIIGIIASTVVSIVLNIISH